MTTIGCLVALPRIANDKTIDSRGAPYRSLISFIGYIIGFLLESVGVNGLPTGLLLVSHGRPMDAHESREGLPWIIHRFPVGTYRPLVIELVAHVKRYLCPKGHETPHAVILRSMFLMDTEWANPPFS